MIGAKNKKKVSKTKVIIGQKNKKSKKNPIWSRRNLKKNIALFNLKLDECRPWSA